MLEKASAYIDDALGKPATSATKAKTASRIATAADGVTDASKLHSVAIGEGPARRIEADRFKSWRHPDRMIPGCRVRKPWRPRRIFYLGWRRRHLESLIHRAEPAGWIRASAASSMKNDASIALSYPQNRTACRVTS